MSREKLRIGITCYPTYGGSGVIATEIGMAMAKRGHRVHFICYDVPRRLERFTENIYFHEVEVNDYPLFQFTPYSLALASKMVEVVTYEELQILHVHYAIPHAASAYLARQILGARAPKVIATLHGTDITLVGNDRSYLPITRFSITESDGVTTPSKYLRAVTYDKLNVPTKMEIDVIPNFVDTKKFHPLENRSIEGVHKALGPCAEGEKIITHVSNFRPVKRLADVIRVFHEVRKSVPCHLVLIGDGPERSRIENMVHELGLSKAVCFMGKLQTFTDMLQHSDLFLLPSETESFGLAALEALSCGVPVVASNIGGVPEVVVHGEAGYLSEVGDIDDMARNAIKLLTDPTLHSAMSRKAREVAVERYSQDRTCDIYENYYYQVLERPRKNATS